MPGCEPLPFPAVSAPVFSAPEAFGGDPACTDCKWVPRLPGFLNCKYDPAYPVTGHSPLRQRSEKSYAAAELNTLSVGRKRSHDMK